MTSPADGDDRDDVQARFADIVARWDDPPPEALGATGEEDPGSDRPVDDGPSPTPEDDTRGTPNASPAVTGDLPEAADISPEASERTASGEREPRADPAPVARPPDHAAGTGWREHSPPEDEDEGYRPPPPSPLPSFWLDWPFYLALVGLVGGPLWLIYLAFSDGAGTDLMWVAGGLTIVGFVTLVLRQPRERDVDDDDDGARV